jgi:ADP-ribose pyrophosphatase YjhB (NUDIX family)
MTSPVLFYITDAERASFDRQDEVFDDLEILACNVCTRLRTDIHLRHGETVVGVVYYDETACSHIRKPSGASETTSGDAADDAVATVYEQEAERERVANAERAAGARDSAVKLCATGLVTDPSGRILLVHHRERGWELPSGKVEPGEPWRESLAREVREETGLHVALAEEHPRLLVGEPAPGAPFASWIALARGTAVGLPRPVDPDGLIDDARWFARDDVPLNELSQLASAEVVRAWARAAPAPPAKWPNPVYDRICANCRRPPPATQSPVMGCPFCGCTAVTPRAVSSAPLSLSIAGGPLDVHDAATDAAVVIGARGPTALPLESPPEPTYDPCAAQTVGGGP